MTNNSTGPMTNSSMNTPPSSSIDIHARVRALQAAAQKNSPIVFSEPAKVLIYFKHDLSTPHTSSLESYLSYFIEDTDDHLTDIHSELFLTFLSDYIIPSTTIGLAQDIIDQMKIAIETKEATLCYKEQGRTTNLTTAHAVNRYIDRHMQAGTIPVISIKFPQDIQSMIQKTISPSGQTATTPASSGPSTAATPAPSKPPSQPPSTPGPSQTAAHVTFQTPQHVTTRFRRLSTKGSAVTPGIHQAQTSTPHAPVPPQQVSTNPLFPNVGTHTQLCLQALSSETFNTRTFLHSIQDLTINDPTIEGIQKLYRSLDGAIMSALKTSHNIFPPFMQLNVSTTLCDQILGATQSTQQYVDAQETYGIISNQLYTIFTTKNIIGDSMTKAKIVLSQRSSTVLCGFDLFYEIMKKYLPQLGADPLNISKLINDLQIQDGDTLFTYYNTVRATQTNILLSQQIAPVHDLHQKFLSQLMQTDQYKTFLHPTYIAFTQHVRLNKTTPFHLTLDDIYDQLEVTADVDEPLRMATCKKQTIISSATHQKKPYIDTTKRTSTTSKRSTNKSDTNSSKPKPWELPYHPEHNRRGRCGACGFTGHGPSTCGFRGAEFIPIALRKPLDRFNKTHPHIKPDPKWINKDFPPPPPIREVKSIEFSDQCLPVVQEEEEEHEDAQEQEEEPVYSIDIHASYSTEVPNQQVQQIISTTELTEHHEEAAEIIDDDMMHLTLEDLDVPSSDFTPEISYTNRSYDRKPSTQWTTVPIRSYNNTKQPESTPNPDRSSKNYYSILAESTDDHTINNHDSTSTVYTSSHCPYHSLRHHHCTKPISRITHHTIQHTLHDLAPSIRSTPIMHNTSYLRRLHTILFLRRYHRFSHMRQLYIHLRISRTKVLYRRPTPSHPLQPTPVERYANYTPQLQNGFLLDIGSNAPNNYASFPDIQARINHARQIHALSSDTSSTSSASSDTSLRFPPSHTLPIVWTTQRPYPIQLYEDLTRDMDIPNVWSEPPPYPTRLYDDVARDMAINFPTTWSLPSEPPSLVSIPHTLPTVDSTRSSIIDSISSVHSQDTNESDTIPELVNRLASTVSSDDSTHASISTVYEDDYQQQFWVYTTDMSTSTSHNTNDNSQPYPEINTSERPSSSLTPRFHHILSYMEDCEDIAERRARLRRTILHRADHPVMFPPTSPITRDNVIHQFDTCDLLDIEFYELLLSPHVTYAAIDTHFDLMESHQRVLLATCRELSAELDRRYPVINMLHVNHNTSNKSIRSSSTYSTKSPSLPSTQLKYQPFLAHIAVQHTPKVIKRRCEFLWDSGANTHLAKDPTIYHAFKASSESFQQSGGSSAHCSGHGTVIADLGTICPLTDVLYKPDAARNIISPVILKKTLGWKSAPHDMGSSFSYTTKDNIHVKIPYVDNPTDDTPTPYFKRDNLLDILVVDIIEQPPHELNNTEKKDNYGTFLHLGLNHAGRDTLQRTIKHGGFTDFPKNIHLPSCTCPICLEQNAPKPTAGPTIKYNTYKPGQFLFMDFVFFNVESIRGFHSALRIIDGNTSMPFTFTTRHKRAPLSILTWFLNYLDRNDRACKIVRTDRGGELADNTEIRKLFAERGISVQDTGGYAPHKNGKVESRNRPLKRSVRALLQHSPEVLDETFWCYALEYGDFADRRLIRKGQTTSPYQQWTTTTPSAKDIHIWGCIVYICRDSSKTLEAKNYKGLFLGYGNTTKNIIYYDLDKRTIGRAGKAIFDDFDISAQSLQVPFAHILRDQQLPQPPSELQLETSSSYFTDNNTFTYTVTIPKKGPLRYTLETDHTFGLPRVSFVGKTSPFYKNLPYKYRKNVFLVRLHDDEPITAEHTTEYIQHLRDTDTLTFQVTLAKAPPSDTTEFRQLVTYCDQLRPIINTTEKEISIVIRTPDKPTIPTYATMKDDPYRQYWIKSLFERYVKNMDVPVWTGPISKSLMPSDATLFQPVVVRSVRDTADTDVWELYTRICQNENAKQAKLQRLGKEKEFGAAYVVNPTSLRILLALAAQMNMEVYSGDVSNAFQVTPIPVDGQPRFMYAPPLFVQWFKERYPNIPVQGEAPYVVQLLTMLNGAVDAASGFYILISRYLKEIGYTATSYDMGVFSKTIVKDGTRHYSWVPLLTDDFIVLCTATFLFEELKAQLDKGLTVVYQNGPVYQFGNYRIIKSEHGISIDQTQAILTNIDRFYVNKDIAHVRTNIPMRTDKEFNDEMYNALPLDPEALKKVEKLYGASYLTIYGSLINWEAGTRFDIANALHRLGVFQAAPTLLGFQGLRKILDYLKTHPNMPIFYPAVSKDTTSTYHSGVFHDDKEDTLIVPHCLCGHKDVSHAPYRRNRHSVTACIETISGVAVGWKVASQLSCEPSTSGGEIRGYFQENQRVKGTRIYFKDLGVSEAQPTPIYEDNKGSRDMIKSGRVTKNLKHIDIPLCIIIDDHLEGVTECRKCTTHTAISDFLSKITPGPKILKARTFLAGARFLPPKDSQHYQLLIHPLGHDSQNNQHPPVHMTFDRKITQQK